MKYLTKKRIISSILFASFFSFIGCNQINIEKELILIDSLQSVIKEVEIKTKEINIVDIKIYKESITKKLNFIKDQYSDSIKWETAKFLNQYYGIKKSFKKYIAKDVFFKDEIKYSNDQLNNLKHDLEENIIHLDSFNIYYEVELQAIKDLNSLIIEEVDNIKIALEKHEKSIPKIEKLLKQIEKSKDSISN